MLQLIIGTAGTGKSVFIKEKILDNAAKGRKSVLIVPEQFSKTAETEIFSSLEKVSSVLSACSALHLCSGTCIQSRVQLCRRCLPMRARL